MEYPAPGNGSGKRRRRKQERLSSSTTTAVGSNSIASTAHQDTQSQIKGPADDPQTSPITPPSPKPSALCCTCSKWRQLWCDVTSPLYRLLHGFTSLFRQVRRPRWKKPRLIPSAATLGGAGGGRGGRGSGKSSGADGGGESELSIFPTSTLWLLHVVVLCVRVYIASRRSNMWILHPDEVYQSVEVAHSEVHGYGYRPYEYLPPPSPPAPPPPAPPPPAPPPSAPGAPGPGVALPPAAPDTAAERQEAEAGMYSLRSPLWPAVFVPPLGLAHLVGLDASPLLVAKVFHAFVAAHLPLAVHYLAHALFGYVDDVSIMAAIVTACSCPLTVLGTHTLINSFLSPFLVFLLGFYIRHATSVYRKSKSNESTKSLKSNNKGILKNNENKEIHVENISHGMANGHASSTQNIGTKESVSFVKAQLKSTLSQDKHLRVSNGHVKPNNNIKKCNGVKTIENAQTITKETVQEDRHQNEKDLHDCESSSTFIHQVAFCGAGFGIVTYMRVDLVLQVFVVIMCLFMDKIIKAMLCRDTAFFTYHLHLLKGYVAATIFCGFVDKMAYGYWFLSPYQWFAFNVKNELASILFGEQDHLFYIHNVYFNDLVVMISTGCVLLGALICLIQKDIRQKIGLVFWRLILAYGILLLIYSFQGHKEIRFIHNLFVIHCIIFALSLHIIVECLTFLHNIIKILIVYVTVIVLAFACWHAFPNPAHSENPEWTYLKTWDSAHVNECLDFIGRQPDTTGVFLDRSIHITGAYSILHRDIPIFSLVHFEFQEFDFKSRKSVPSVFGYTNLNISIMSRVSNFISIKNAPLLLKHLLQNPQYNYLVLKRSRQTIRSGFDDVFFSGPIKVMRRSPEPEVQRHLASMAERIPIGTNATILEYEGSWLYTLGQHDKAVERLEAALVLDPGRVRAYQLLCAAHGAVERAHEAQEVYARCWKRFGDQCAQPQSKVVLHADYDIGLQL